MLLNLLVIFANNGMPVVSLQESMGRWIPLTTDSYYVYLSDIHHIGKMYYSIGDLIIFIGLILTTYFLFKWLFRKRCLN